MDRIYLMAQTLFKQFFQYYFRPSSMEEEGGQELREEVQERHEVCCIGKIMCQGWFFGTDIVLGGVKTRAKPLT